MPPLTALPVDWSRWFEAASDTREASVDGASVLMVPGLGGSEAGHWQYIWEARNPEFRRVEQRDWEDPDPHEWAVGLESAVVKARAPVVLVAHSLSCALVAQWALRSGAVESSVAKVAAAMLVSPADVESETRVPPEARRFAPMALCPLPFRAAVVASDNDPYVDPERARLFARRWHARFVGAGDRGHINVDSGHGEWPEGERVLTDLLGEAETQATGSS